MKILDINTNLQIPNMVHKSETDNKVKQVTDHASGIPFVQSDDAKKPVYNYDGYLEFDGVDDYLEAPNNKAFDLANSWAIDFWIKIKANHAGAIFNCDNVVSPRHYMFYVYQLSIFVFDGTNNANLTGGSLVVDQWHHIRIEQSTNNKTVGFLDGRVKIKSTTAFNSFDSDGQVARLGSHYQAGNKLNAELKNFDISTPIFDYDSLSVSDEVFTPKQPFPFYKRYKDDGNKKLFLSSRYLENADINNSDEITSIESEIGTIKTVRSTPAGGMQITKNGFRVGATGRFVHIEDIYYGTNDYYNSCWLKIENTSENPNIIFGRLYMMFSYSGDLCKIRMLAYTNDQSTPSLYSPDFEDYRNKFTHFAIARKNGIGYIFINGVLKTAATFDGDITTYANTQICNNQTGWIIDDVLCVNGDSIIDPTGYNVGQKVFEPPRRRSLDSNFIQYPIP